MRKMKNRMSYKPYKPHKLLMLLLWIACALTVSAQVKEFTPAEMQSISVETPGLFDRSDAFSIDFTALHDNE